jgi:hypothetical protein
MAAVGGIAKAITLDGRTFAAGAAVTIFLGGTTKTLTPVGTGQAVVDAKPETWEVKGCKVLIDPDNNDLEFLTELASRTDFPYYPCTVELLSGVAYTGLGTIVERVEFNSEGTMAEFTMQGEQKLEQL